MSRVPQTIEEATEMARGDPKRLKTLMIQMAEGPLMQRMVEKNAATTRLKKAATQFVVAMKPFPRHEMLRAAKNVFDEVFEGELNLDSAPAAAAAPAPAATRIPPVPPLRADETAAAAPAPAPAADETDEPDESESADESGNRSDADDDLDKNLIARRRMKFKAGSQRVVVRPYTGTVYQEAEVDPTTAPRIDLVLFRYVRTAALRVKEWRDVYERIRKVERWQFVGADANEGQMLPYKSVSPASIGRGMWRDATISAFDLTLYREHFKRLADSTVPVPWMTTSMINMQKITHDQIESVRLSCQVVPCGFTNLMCTFCAGNISVDGPQKVTYTFLRPMTHRDSIACHFHGRCAAFLKLVDSKCPHHFFTTGLNCVECV